MKILWLLLLSLLALTACAPLPRLGSCQPRTEVKYVVYDRHWQPAGYVKGGRIYNRHWQPVGTVRRVR